MKKEISISTIVCFFSCLEIVYFLLYSENVTQQVSTSSYSSTVHYGIRNKLSTCFKSTSNKQNIYRMTSECRFTLKLDNGPICVLGATEQLPISRLFIQSTALLRFQIYVFYVCRCT